MLHLLVIDVIFKNYDILNHHLNYKQHLESLGVFFDKTEKETES